MAGVATHDGGLPLHNRVSGRAVHPARLLRPAWLLPASPATTRAVSAARRPAWECGPDWASAALDRGAERPQVLRSPRGRAGLDVGLTRGGVGGSQLIGAATANHAAGGQ